MEKSTPYADALQQIDALYAALPTVVCQRKCQDSCGVIVMAKLEWLRIQRKLGYKPKGKSSLVCPMLKQGACSVHDIRPTVCRLFGVLADEPQMRCPHGCRPEQWLQTTAGFAWLALAEDISRAVFPGTEATAFAHGITPAEIPAYIKQALEAGKVHYETNSSSEGTTL